MQKAQQMSFLEEAISEKICRLEKWILSKSKRYEQDVYIALQEIYILKNVHTRNTTPTKNQNNKIEQLSMFG